MPLNKETKRNNNSSTFTLEKIETFKVLLSGENCFLNKFLSKLKKYVNLNERKKSHRYM